MPKSKYMIAFIATLIIAGLFIYYRANAASKVSNHVYGPFVIRMEKFSTKNFNMNYGWVREENISYSVLHKGSIVQFPAALQSNTGFSHLWRAYIHHHISWIFSNIEFQRNAKIWQCTDLL